jgi:hypothetical protein
VGIERLTGVRVAGGSSAIFTARRRLSRLRKAQADVVTIGIVNGESCGSASDWRRGAVFEINGLQRCVWVMDYLFWRHEDESLQQGNKVMNAKTWTDLTAYGSGQNVHAGCEQHCQFFFSTG